MTYLVPVQRRESNQWVDHKQVSVKAATKAEARAIVSRRFREPRFKVGEPRGV